ncbi:MAG: hypothetical protein H0V90_01820 [Blastocatellia bacterium]|nr:hypothetical protein [Blastocatellia bacterium]MDQ3118891.1 hypothetical protein [Verrucomicrobiota bacterium]MDQ3414361.1 hypothetical protein [Verrucomicrobiota bacterium]
MTKAISKSQKILAVMFELAKGESKPLHYEDIVVFAFKRHPQDFQLRGYPEYPDSSDLHKPLYAMKRDGLVRSASDKSFLLTARGLEVARGLAGAEEAPRDRLTKGEENEIKRIIKSPAFELFRSGQAAKILDTDFYEYLGASVRTPKGDFLGRLSVVEQAITAHREKINDSLSEALNALHRWMEQHFQDEILARK